MAGSGFFDLAQAFPPDWEQMPFWTNYRRVKRPARGDEELLSVYRDHGVIRKSDRDDNFNKPSDDLTTYQVVESGDLVVNKMKAWQGSVAVSRLNGIVSPAYFVFSPVQSKSPRFMHYLLRSSPYIAAYRAGSKGIRPNQWDLDPDILRTFPLPSPPIELQQRIAGFLDRETAEIDAFIADQEELIGLLSERRAATIRHAVTKGLDPSVPMKDSGVEWLGAVPEHWHVTRLSRFFSVTLGKMLDVGKTAPPGTVVLPYIRAANIQESGLDTASVNEMAFTAAEVRNLDIRAGDLLVVEGGAVGVNVHMDASLEGWSFQKTVNRVRPRTSSASSRFLGFVIDALRWSGVIDMVANKSTIAHLTAEKLERLVVGFPPPREQRYIESYLLSETAEIDAVIADAREAISLSRERRAALISAAVTGKIDVREAA